MAVPTPSATGYQQRGGGRLGRGSGREGCLVLRPKQGLCSCWPNETHWLSGLGSASGRDFWGVTTSPEDRERSCRCPWRGEAPSWGHLHMVGKDKGVDTCQLGWKVGLRDGGVAKRGGLARACVRSSTSPPSYPVTSPTLPGIETTACCPFTPWDSEWDGWEPGDRDVGQFTHWAWLRTLAHRTKGRPRARLHNLGPAWGCSHAR